MSSNNQVFNTLIAAPCSKENLTVTAIVTDILLCT